MPKLGGGDKHDWWRRHWRAFAQEGSRADDNTLPRPRNEARVLPEADLLKPIVFANDGCGKRRFDVARAVAKAAASDHAAVCEHLGGVFDGNPAIALLPRFSRLADAGMAAMDLVAGVLRTESRVALSDVAAAPRAAEVCNELVAAAEAWRTGPATRIRHIDTAHQFAAMVPSGRPMPCLRALLEYHELHGGGLRWFVLRDGKVEPRTPPRGQSSRYRFRLWSLCRLAAQCGVLRGMPGALRDDEEPADDETLEDVDE